MDTKTWPSLSPPKLGPEPTLISRKEVDALYELLAAVSAALASLGVDYIVTGGSLLGAIRQHSLLFCDDDVDIAIIDHDGGHGAYEAVRAAFEGGLLGPLFAYTVRPWEGGDRVRLKRMPTVFLDLFTLRRYGTRQELEAVLGVKKNGEPQSEGYVKGILEKMEASAFAGDSAGEAATPLYPCWHFNTRKSVEMWCKEVYREEELFPLDRTLEFGPLPNICGPRMPVRLLRRAFGADCFEVYYQSGSHAAPPTPKPPAAAAAAAAPEQKNPSLEVRVAAAAAAMPTAAAQAPLPPLLQTGGQWEGGRKAFLEDGHFRPMQPVSRKQRRPTNHCRESLLEYLALQEERERAWVAEATAAEMVAEVVAEVVAGEAAEGCGRLLGEQEKQRQHGPGLGLPSNEASRFSSGSSSVSSRVHRGAGAQQQHRRSAEILWRDGATTATRKQLQQQHQTQQQTQHDQLTQQHDQQQQQQQPEHGPTQHDPLTDGQTRTVYLDGVFDLFHCGHLEAIQQCVELGGRVVVGVTGDSDATGYKRQPTVREWDRATLVAALKGVDKVVCPCPLVVTEEFMAQEGIDLVVHSFASDEDAAKQAEFFDLPMRTNRFQRIRYSTKTSTTEIIAKIVREGRGDDGGSEDSEDGSDGGGGGHNPNVSAAVRRREDKEKPSQPTAPVESSSSSGPPPPPPLPPSSLPPPKRSQPPKKPKSKKSEWFGAALASATGGAPGIPNLDGDGGQGFPLSLRLVMEPHLRKARLRRSEALDAVRCASGPERYDLLVGPWEGQLLAAARRKRTTEGGGGDGADAADACAGACGTASAAASPAALFGRGGTGGGGTGKEGSVSGDDDVDGPHPLHQLHHQSWEGDFSFDAAAHPLRLAFLRSGGLPADTDLSRLTEESQKAALLRSFAEQAQSHSSEQLHRSESFQSVYDAFVRTVCVPKLASLLREKGVSGLDVEVDEVYYQAFPCVRVVPPDAFSIGPHCDASYGHHPCSLNFYVPLTPMGGTSALFLESIPGLEDWHAVEAEAAAVTGPGGKEVNTVKHFAGAVCSHWTMENKTGFTRVSLDFRLLPGHLFKALACGGAEPKGQLDVYRAKEGFYSCAKRRRVRRRGGLAVAAGGEAGGGDEEWEWEWEREGPLLPPDARVGFPFTVSRRGQGHAEASRGED